VILPRYTRAATDWPLLDYFYFLSLEALVRLYDSELDLLTFLKRPVPGSGNLGVMYKDVSALIAHKEAITFFGTKPFNGAGFTLCHTAASPVNTVTSLDRAK
jgi:hypothetical protein